MASVQHQHITCASPCIAVHLDCFALRVAFPRSPVGHDSHDYYQSSVAISLAEGRRSRVSSPWYVLATDVGHPLISLLDLIGHRLRRRGCTRREAVPAHIVASLPDVVAMGDKPPRSEIGFQAIQPYPYRAGLAVHHPTRLLLTTAFSACCCSLCVSTSGQPVTQEHSSQFLLTAPGIPSCATRRTLSACR
jgi:hypothetical protein